MTDTTAPLAVTMDLIGRAETIVTTGFRTVGDGRIVAAVFALARRCLEPDGEMRVAAAIEAVPYTDRFNYRKQARAAIAALVNPDG